MSALVMEPIDLNNLQVGNNPAEALRFKIRHNLVADISKAKRKLSKLQRQKP